MMTSFPISAALFPALWALNLGVIVPLSLSCLVLVVVIPAAAWRGKLNVPVYALMLFVSAFVAYGIGKLAGAQSVHGTTLGVVVSFIFFLLVATAAGCFFGIFFYRQPTEESTSESGSQDVSSAIPVLEDDRQ
jgi:uncharacterized membrane protein YedE/YeeE